MKERNSSVKGLRDYYQGIVANLKKENESFQQVKQNSTSVPPQRNSVSRESLQFNLQKFEQKQTNKDDITKYIALIEQLQKKVKFYEQRQDNNDFNKLNEQYNNQKIQLEQLSEMNDQLNEELIQAHQKIANLESEVQKAQKIQIPELTQISEQKIQVEHKSQSTQDQEIQVDLLSPIVEQNKLLIERLHENPAPQGKQLIIINSAQSIELRRQMETLKQELVERLNQYNNYIQNKQLAQIKKSIKVDISQIYSTYIQMFQNINRPIQNVEQVGKILSPIYQDELNEFLGQLSDFLDKFRLVSIL